VEPQTPLELSIGELARQTGLAASALRYYESLGLIAALRRTGGQRRFDPLTARKVRLIQVAQQAGFSIAEIGVLLNGFPEGTPPRGRWEALAQAKLSQVDQLIADAHRMRALLLEGMQCGCLRWEDCALEIGTACPPNTPQD